MKSRRRGCVIGCLGVCLLAGCMMATALWMNAATVRRAKTIHASIQTNMSFAAVQATLSGRYLVGFQAQANEEWRALDTPRAEHYLKAPHDEGQPVPPIRMTIHVMGNTPLRVSFIVEFDERGRVETISKPRGWD